MSEDINVAVKSFIIQTATFLQTAEARQKKNHPSERCFWSFIWNVYVNIVNIKSFNVVNVPCWKVQTRFNNISLFVN